MRYVQKQELLLHVVSLTNKNDRCMSLKGFFKKSVYTDFTIHLLGVKSLSKYFNAEPSSIFEFFVTSLDIGDVRVARETISINTLAQFKFKFFKRCLTRQ